MGKLIRRFGPTLFFVFTALLTVRAVFLISTTFAPDFSVYYQSSVNLINGRNIYSDPSLYTGLGYPPFSLLFFLPLASLSYQVAQVIWILFSVFCLSVSVYILLRLLGKLTWKFYALSFSLAIISFPTRFTLGMGQVNIVALFFVVLFVFFHKKNPLLAGLMLGVSLIFKPHFILLLPYLLLVGSSRKTVGVAILILLAAIIFTGVLFGFDLYATYMGNVVPALAVYTGREIYYNQGVGALFARVLPTSVGFIATMASSLFLYVLGASIIFRRRETSLLAVVCLFFPIFLLIEPLSWQHHYVFLLPTFLYAFLQRQHRRIGMFFLFLSYLLIGANLRNPEAYFQYGVIGKLLISHVLWGTLVLLGIFIFTLVTDIKETS